jgi:CheY-like chemotaxis protein
MPGPGSGVRGRILIERLESIAQPDVASAILARAIEISGGAMIPGDAAAFGAFVVGPLVDAITERLGELEAHAVRDDLIAVLARPSGDDDKPASGMRWKSDAPPARRVIVIGEDERARELKRALFGEADVQLARDAFQLVQLVEIDTERPIAVVVIGDVVTLRGPMLAAMAAALPASAHLVFWGAPHATETLPRRAANAPDDANVEEIALLAITTPPRDPTPQPERPLIVIGGANSAWRIVLIHWLGRDGYRVAACEDGYAVLEACLGQTPAFVILERHLAAIDGRDVVKLLRSRFGAKAPPTLIVAQTPVTPVTGESSIVLAKGEPPTRLLEEVRARAPIT